MCAQRREDRRGLAEVMRGVPAVTGAPQQHPQVEVQAARRHGERIGLGEAVAQGLRRRVGVRFGRRPGGAHPDPRGRALRGRRTVEQGDGLLGSSRVHEGPGGDGVPGPEIRSDRSRRRVGEEGLDRRQDGARATPGRRGLRERGRDPLRQIAGRGHARGGRVPVRGLGIPAERADLGGRPVRERRAQHDPRAVAELHRLPRALQCGVPVADLELHPRQPAESPQRDPVRAAHGVAGGGERGAGAVEIAEPVLDPAHPEHEPLGHRDGQARLGEAGVHGAGGTDEVAGRGGAEPAEGAGFDRRRCGSAELDRPVGPRDELGSVPAHQGVQAPTVRDPRGGERAEPRVHRLPGPFEPVLRLRGAARLDGDVAEHGVPFGAGRQCLDGGHQLARGAEVAGADVGVDGGDAQLAGGLGVVRDAGGGGERGGGRGPFAAGCERGAVVGEGGRQRGIAAEHRGGAVAQCAMRVDDLGRGGMQARPVGPRRGLLHGAGDDRRERQHPRPVAVAAGENQPAVRECVEHVRGHLHARDGGEVRGGRAPEDRGREGDARGTLADLRQRRRHALPLTRGHRVRWLRTGTRRLVERGQRRLDGARGAPVHPHRARCREIESEGAGQRGHLVGRERVDREDHVGAERAGGIVPEVGDRRLGGRACEHDGCPALRRGGELAELGGREPLGVGDHDGAGGEGRAQAVAVVRREAAECLHDGGLRVRQRRERPRAAAGRVADHGQPGSADPPHRPGVHRPTIGGRRVRGAAVQPRSPPPTGSTEPVR